MRSSRLVACRIRILCNYNMTRRISQTLLHVEVESFLLRKAKGKLDGCCCTSKCNSSPVLVRKGYEDSAAGRNWTI